MLSEIRIESLGAISTATAEFDRGLTVLTGETGTGKTMVVTGLHLLGGARADATRIRSGADRAVVEGRFSTGELGDGVASQVDEILDASGADRDEDGSVIAARSVSRNGPSRAFLGGRSVPAKSLSTFTTELLTLHGQNDQLRLMRGDEQRAALDRFADVGSQLRRYRAVRESWQTGPPRPGRKDPAGKGNGAGGRPAEVRPRRDRRGRSPARRGRHTRRRHQAVVRTRRLARGRPSRSLGAVRGARRPAADADAASAAHEVAQAKSALEATDDTALRALGERLAEALAVIGDVSTELGEYLTELPSDASTLETKLARQSELRALTRKYAADIDGVLSWARESRERLAQLDVSEETLAALERRVAELEAEVVAAATELSKLRTKAAKGLAKAVTAELAGLAMADAEFTVTVSPLTARGDDSAPITLPSGATVHAGSDGADAVEFGFSAHRGTDVLPLNKSASGGELSRVMLALEVVLAASVEGTTMVFDEVDAGVGGRAAVQIGRRLARLARTHQVIVVTHLPQVAAYADIHLVVDSAGRNSASGVRRLDDDDRVAELARMLAGLGDSDSGRAHARELLDAAQEDREKVS